MGVCCVRTDEVHRDEALERVVPAELGLDVAQLQAVAQTLLSLSELLLLLRALSHQQLRAQGLLRVAPVRAHRGALRDGDAHTFTLSHRADC